MLDPCHPGLLRPSCQPVPLPRPVQPIQVQPNPGIVAPPIEGESVTFVSPEDLEQETDPYASSPPLLVIIVFIVLVIMWSKTLFRIPYIITVCWRRADSPVTRCNTYID